MPSKWIIEFAQSYSPFRKFWQISEKLALIVFFLISSILSNSIDLTRKCRIVNFYSSLIIDHYDPPLLNNAPLNTIEPKIAIINFSYYVVPNVLNESIEQKHNKA